MGGRSRAISVDLQSSAGHETIQYSALLAATVLTKGIMLDALLSDISLADSFVYYTRTRRRRRIIVIPLAIIARLISNLIPWVVS